MGRVPLLRHTLESGVHWWLGDFRRLGYGAQCKEVRVSSGTRADRGHRAGSWEGAESWTRVASTALRGQTWSPGIRELTGGSGGVTAMPRPSRRCLSSYLSHSNNNKKLLMSFLSTDGQTEARMTEAPCLKLKGGVGSQSSELILLQSKLHGRLTLLCVA